MRPPLFRITTPRTARVLLGALPLLPVLLAGSACAPLGGGASPAILERIGDGEYDFGIRYPSRRARYVMIVDQDEETLTVSNRAVTAEPAPSGPAPEPTVPQPADRVLAPCAEALGNWYRHTPAGYVCVGDGAPSAAPGG